jgi:ribosomal protein S18 acetylase RimI-like enzyme
MEKLMVQLVPMTMPEFAAFLERDIQEYAEEQVRAGYWSEPEALQRSRQEHTRLLPKGLRTRDHHFFTIQDATGQAMGMIWLNTRLVSSRTSGHIYALEVDEPFRRKGYARQAMRELETVARGMGLKQLSLHVFAHNEGARALYEGLGYKTSSLNMLKEL